ncbi:hypothetical protein BDR04DRAFT_56424 [Suillus decipiens]|nr:hypothetical protein BDR04DRAFT_56424 [Suillus decipiens]
MSLGSGRLGLVIVTHLCLLLAAALCIEKYHSSTRYASSLTPFSFEQWFSPDTVTVPPHHAKSSGSTHETMDAKMHCTGN